MTETTTTGRTQAGLITQRSRVQDPAPAVQVIEPDRLVGAQCGVVNRSIGKYCGALPSGLVSRAGADH
jgi:hypothetical protein